MKQHHKKDGRTLLIVAVFSGLLLSSLLYSLFIRGFTTIPAQAAGAEDYCREGIYYLPNGSNEDKCGRAANCGGWDYDQANSIPFQNAKTCWGGTHCEADTSPCEGNVPLCCYEVERTGDPMKCNFPERGFCHPQQCNAIPSNGSFECGSGDRCRCGSQLKTYCITIDKDSQGNHCANNESELIYKSLSERLGDATAQPTTAVPTTIIVTPTPTKPPITTTTCTIQGFKELVGGQGSTTIINPLTVLLPGYPEKTSTQNPYVLTVPGNATYSVSIENAQGYGASSTYCTNRTDCHTAADTSKQNALTRTNVYCPAGGFADVWWHFTLLNTPTPTPTLVLGAGQCAGVQHCSYKSATNEITYAEYCGECSGEGCTRPGYTCREPNYTCKTYNSKVFYTDVLYAVPCNLITGIPVVSPTIIEAPISASATCSPLPTLVWRDSTRYTRTVISSNGTSSVETIALHLQQIVASGVTVQISTDNGSTWTNVDPSQDGNYVITIQNRSTESITLMARLVNACTQSENPLIVTAATVSLPATAQTATPAVTVAQTRSISRELIIGGALLAALIVAAFFVGA